MMLVRVLAFLLSGIFAGQILNAQNEEAPFFLPVKVNGLWGFIDTEGRIQIQPNYQWVSDVFFKTYIIVELNHKQGIIDTHGNTLVPCIYQNIQILDTNAFISKTIQPYNINNDIESVLVSKPTLIQEEHLTTENFYQISPLKGQAKLRKYYSNISKYTDSLYVTTDNLQKGLITVNQEIFPPQFDSFYLIDTLVITKKDSLRGCISLKGNVILENLYQKIISNEQFLIITKNDKKALYCLTNNQFITDFIYDDFQFISVDKTTFVLVKISEKFGLINGNGKEITPLVYDKIESALSTQEKSPLGFYIWLNNKVGIIDLKGKAILDTEYDQITLTSENLLLIRNNNDYGVMNTSGKFLYPMQKGRIQFYSDYFKVYDNKGLLVVNFDKNGMITEQNRYENIRTITVSSRIFENNQLLLANANSMAVFSDSNLFHGWFYNKDVKRWGLKDKNDSIRINPIFFKVDDVANTPYSVCHIEIIAQDEKMPQKKIIDRKICIVDKLQYRLITKPEYDKVDMNNLTSNSGCNYIVGNRNNKYCLICEGKPAVEYNYIGSCYDGFSRVNLKGKETSKLKNKYSVESTGNNRMRFQQYNTNIQSQIMPQTGYWIELTGGRWGLLDCQGNIAIPIQYHFIGNYSNGRVIAKGEKKWGVLSVKGDTIIPFGYDNINFIENSKDSLFLVKKLNTKYGLIDSNGIYLTACIFDTILPFSEGLAPVRINKKWGFVNKSGTIVITPKYKRVCPFSEGLAAVKLKPKWGYINYEGELIFTGNYSVCGDFNNGLAWVKQKGKYGFIEKNGQLVIPAQYTKVESFKNELALVRKRNKNYVIDKNNKIIVKARNKYFKIYHDEGIIVASNKKNHTFYNLQGIKTGEIKTSKLGNFSEGLAFASKKDLFGYIDSRGKFIIQPQFQNAQDFSNGLAEVELNHKWGFINKSGNTEVPFEYEWVSKYTEVITAVRKNKMVYIIDKKGKEIFSHENSQSNGFKKGYVNIELNRRKSSFYMDTTCIPMIFPGFIYVSPLNSNLLQGWNFEKGQWYLIDKSGTPLAPIPTDFILSEDRITNIHKEIKQLGQGMLSYSAIEYVNITDLNGNMLFNEDFDSIQYIGSGIFRVNKLNKIGYILENGKWLWELQ